MSTIDIQSFRETFRGQLFEPADAGYDEARRIWNASVNKRPRLIAQCSGVADVVAAVNFGRENDLLTAIRGGGHNVGGRALCDDGIVIDLSRMRSVYVDTVNRSVRVQGGATLGDLDRETHVFGLAVPSGIVPKTGIGGLTLGGGVGWLLRKYGMSIDNLLSCQIITADGKVLTANASENEDLFWALRGGGGNFGVVTSFEFRAHPVHTVLGGLLLYPRNMALDVIRHFRDYIESAPDELTAYAAFLYGPDATPLVGVIACYCGDIAEGNASCNLFARSAARRLMAFNPCRSPRCRRCSPHLSPMGTRIIGSPRCNGNYQTMRSPQLSSTPTTCAPLFPLLFSNIMPAPRAGLRSMPPHSLTAIFRGISCLSRSGLTRRRLSTHRDWARSGEEILRPFSGERPSPYPRSTSKSKTSST